MVHQDKMEPQEQMVAKMHKAHQNHNSVKLFIFFKSYKNINLEMF